MKRASVVSLIVAAVLILSGLIVTWVASAKAKKDGTGLYSVSGADVENGEVSTYDFTEASVDKLMLDFQNTPVYLTESGSEKSYINFVNFPTGSFDRTETNNLLTFSNHSRISSLIDNVKEGNFTFKGLREFLTYGKKGNGEQKVEVYIGTKTSIRNINILCERGNLFVSDLGMDADFHITVTNGNISFENMATKSLLDATVQNGEIGLTHADAGIGNFYADGKVICSDFACGRLTVVSENSDVILELYARQDDFWVNLSAKNQVLLNGKESGISLITIPDEYYDWLNRQKGETKSNADGEEETTAEDSFRVLPIIDVKAENGNVSLSFSAAAENPNEKQP